MGKMYCNTKLPLPHVTCFALTQRGYRTTDIGWQTTQKEDKNTIIGTRVPPSVGLSASALDGVIVAKIADLNFAYIGSYTELG